MSINVIAALGKAVVANWPRLPRDVQHDLFESVVQAMGEGAREQVARYLHDRHPRTAAHSHRHGNHREVPEPDSLGG